MYLCVLKYLSLCSRIIVYIYIYIYIYIKENLFLAGSREFCSFIYSRFQDRSSFSSSRSTSSSTKAKESESWYSSTPVSSSNPYLLLLCYHWLGPSAIYNKFTHTVRERERERLYLCYGFVFALLSADGFLWACCRGLGCCLVPCDI